MVAPPRPLLILDTNILVDVWLGRNGNESLLLLTLAEAEAVDLMLPEYVLIEFRGTALRWIRDERKKLHQQILPIAREWARSGELDEGAEAILSGARMIEERLAGLQTTIDEVDRRFRAVAHVEQHTHAIHFRGDLRYLSGRPPDRPVDGIKDCRIYEAILEIARADARESRARYLVTRDSDFDHDELRAQLGELGVAIRKDPGRLYGELRPASL